MHLYGEARGLILAVLGVVAGLVVFLVPPISQDPAYHDFADHRAWLGIPNFGDVVSNLPLIGVAVAGVLAVRRHGRDPDHFKRSFERYLFLGAFWGIGLVGPGSVYYHWSPNNDTLLWDRLPMAIGFMSVFSIMIVERVSARAGFYLWPVLLILGVTSVFYWHHTETLGQGDLRWYALVQFFPFLVIPWMLWQFPARYDGVGHLWRLVAWNVLAKVLEHFDALVFQMTGQMVSGHSLKHLAVAIGVYELVRYVKNRRRI